MQRGHVPREHHADLVGENLLAVVVDHPTAVTVAVEAEAEVGLGAQHLVAHGMEHLHVLGIGIVFRERVVELAVEPDNLAADRFEHLRREGARRAVAAGTDHLQLALEFRPFGEIGDVARRKVLDEVIGAAARKLERGIEHDLLQPRHLVGTKGQRPVGAHLHAGPAIVVVRGRDHRDARHVELELREIGHRRHRESDVVHLAAGGEQPGDQRVLYRRRITAKVMAGDDLGLLAKLADQCAEPHAQRLQPHQVDFLAEQPSRVVLAETGWLHHRFGFIGIGVGGQRRLGLGKHQILKIASSDSHTLRPDATEIRSQAASYRSITQFDDEMTTARAPAGRGRGSISPATGTTCRAGWC